MTNNKINSVLIIFDLIFLPIIIFRLILIYFYGSKYNVDRMEFLDVMMHANNPYFNQEVGTTIDILNEDVRATIKRETKLFDEQLINKNEIMHNNSDVQTEPIFCDDVITDTNEKLYANDNIEVDYDIDDNINDDINDDIDDNSDEINENTEIENSATFNLDIHIDQLFDDLENSMTILSQAQN